MTDDLSLLCLFLKAAWLAGFVQCLGWLILNVHGNVLLARISPRMTGTTPDGASFTGIAARATLLLLFWNQKNYFPSILVLEFHRKHSKFGGSCRKHPKWIPSFDSFLELLISELPKPQHPKFWSHHTW